MNAQELFLANGKSAGVYYCGKCHVVHREHTEAEQCCQPRVCECGAECERPFTRCSDCQRRIRDSKEAEQHANAPKRTLLSEYKGDWVYLACEYDYILTDDFADRVADDPEATWLAYACTSYRPQIDIDHAIECALENSYEDARDYVSDAAVTQLSEYVAEWCETNLPLTYEQDPKHAIDIDTALDVGDADRYPLYCVDRGGRVDEECQYVGPFTTHADANERAEDDDLVRRCRQIRPSEIGFNRDSADLDDFDVFDALVDELDQAASEGNLPEGAWYRIGDRIVSSKYDDDTLPTHRDFDTWVDAHLTLTAYICEGDE